MAPLRRFGRSTTGRCILLIGVIDKPGKKQKRFIRSASAAWPPFHLTTAHKDDDPLVAFHPMATIFLHFALQYLQSPHWHIPQIEASSRSSITRRRPPPLKVCGCGGQEKCHYSGLNHDEKDEVRNEEDGDADSENVDGMDWTKAAWSDKNKQVPDNSWMAGTATASMGTHSVKVTLEGPPLQRQTSRSAVASLSAKSLVSFYAATRRMTHDLCGEKDVLKNPVPFSDEQVYQNKQRFSDSRHSAVAVECSKASPGDCKADSSSGLRTAAPVHHGDVDEDCDSGCHSIGNNVVVNVCKKASVDGDDSASVSGSVGGSANGSAHGSGSRSGSGAASEYMSGRSSGSRRRGTCGVEDDTGYRRSVNDGHDGVGGAVGSAAVDAGASNELEECEAFVGDLTKEEFIVGCEIFLTRLLGKAPAYTLPSASDDVSAFFGITEPTITVKSYVSRLVKYAYSSTSAFIVMMIYIERIAECERRLGINQHNMHRVVITALMLACKMLDDRVYSNAHYARVGGVPSAGEMMTLEVLFMRYLGHKMYVNDYMYEDMVFHVSQLGRALPAPITASTAAVAAEGRP